MTLGCINTTQYNGINVNLLNNKALELRMQQLEKEVDTLKSIIELLVKNQELSCEVVKLLA